MLNAIINWLSKIKNYIALFSLLAFSLYCLSLNTGEKTNILRKKTFSLYAFFSYQFYKIYDYFYANEETKDLKKQIAKLTLLNHLYKDYAYQNQELLKAIKIKSEISYDLIPARVSSKNIDKFLTIFLILFFDNDTILPAMPVIGNEGLIGFISETFSNSALVKTYQTKDFKIALKNQRTRIEGIAEWNGKSLVIKNIPLSYDVKLGDIYSTSEFSSIMPAALPVGVVKKIYADKSGIMNIAELEPLENLDKSEFVFIVKAKKAPKINDINLNFYDKSNSQ